MTLTFSLEFFENNPRGLMSERQTSREDRLICIRNATDRNRHFPSADPIQAASTSPRYARGGHPDNSLRETVSMYRYETRRIRLRFTVARDRPDFSFSLRLLFRELIDGTSFPLSKNSSRFKEGTSRVFHEIFIKYP